MTGEDIGGRVLIAGGGDLGARLARRLREHGRRVGLLRRRPPAGSGPDTIAADLTRPESLRGLPSDIDRVVFTAAPDARTPEAYRALFLDGLRHLLEALPTAPLRRVLLVSSSAVYGDHDGGWVDEDTAPAPAAFNGEILLQAERWLAAQPVPTVVLRLAGLYGPGRVHVIERLRSGRARVPRARPAWANRIHVDDAAAALHHLLQLPRPAPLYLGADDTPLPLHELYDALARRMGLPPPPEGPPPAGVGSKRLSNARLRGSGFVPRWPDSREGYSALLAAS